MSTKSKAKSAGGKSTSAKPVGPFVPEPLPPVTPVPTGSTPSNLPFPEWSDQELNAEKWDLPKGKDKGKQKPSLTLKKTTSSTPAEFPAASSLDEPTLFVDPHLVHLPNSLSVHEWKRPSEVFPGANFIMYKESSEYPDLISGSKHLLHSDLMRSFISAIGILEYLGNTRPSPIEFASPTFFPNTGNDPWRPWFHIYSMCKAGKGQKHNPQVNTLGKYVVRLFWLGCWRKIVIDDILPVDQMNHVLLPNLNKPENAQDRNAPITSVSKSTVATESTKGKPNKNQPKSAQSERSQAVIEMWPLLLSKALLKIASLTWTDYNELVDFDIIHSLTGWFMQKVDVKGLDVLDIWDTCAGYTDHYTWPDPLQKRPGTAGSKGGKSDKGSKASSKVPNFLDGEGGGMIPHHVVAMCTDLREKIEGEVPDITPCWSHYFLIDQTRVIPLIKPEPLPELARWKRFRWLAWAIRKGIWPAPELVPIRCFKMVSVFKKCAEHIIYTLPSREALDLKKSVAVIEDLALEMGDGKKKGGKEQNKGKPDKKDKSSKDSKSSKAAAPLPPDPSIWGDFNKLGCYISHLYIYFKASVFSSHYQITDIAQNSAGKEAAKGKLDKGKKSKAEEASPKLLMRYGELQTSRNEPVYLFLDSMDYKLLVINVAQMGNVSTLKKDKNITETPFNEQNGYEAKRSCQYYDLMEVMAQVQGLERPTPRVPFTYVILENYNWQTSQVGDMTTFLNAYGTKSMLVDIKPGRFVLRMWIKSDTCFFINFMSDTPVIAGTLEDILEHMTHEPERLQKMCHNISSTYGQLVQNFGTSNFSEALIAFSRSYLPEYQLSKKQISKIREAFMKELVNVIQQNCLPQEIRQRVFALKVLFMNPFIKFEQPGSEIKEVINKSYHSDINKILDYSDETLVAKQRERAAVVLQAFFKKIYVRKLRALHSQSHKDYMKIFDSLKKNYAENFSVSNRMITGLALIRNFILSNPIMNDLKNYYSVFQDLNSTIFLQHVTGITLASRLSWIPITRQIFHCNSPNPVLIKIYLFCGLPTYMVRVFNNDTNQEIKRFTNNALLYPYENNAFGYTVICYGWSVDEGDYPWKLDFITLKQKTASLIIIPETTIIEHTLKQNYKPNINNLICRLLVNINHDTLATFRLSLSYEKAKVHFRCLNEVGQVFGEIYGVENVILPAVMLKFIPILEDMNPTASSSKQSVASKERKPSKSVRSRSGSLVRTQTNTSIRRKDKNFEKLSLDRYSSKSSMISLKKFRSNSVTRDTVKYKDTVYILEGFVIDESWPLTKDEWNVVDEVKSRNLLGSSLSDTDTFGSLPSKLKLRESFTSRRSADIKDIVRQSLDRSRTISDVKSIDKPFWCVETISDSQDNLTTVLDSRREDEIRDIKRKWYENDQTRYERSKQLREVYLDSHYIKTESTSSSSMEFTAKRDSVVSEYLGEFREEINRPSETEEIIIFSNPLPQLLEIDEEILEEEEEQKAIADLIPVQFEEVQLRTLKRPVSKTKMLPPLNLEDYYLDKINPEEKSKMKEGNEDILEDEQVEEEEINKHVKTLDEAKELELSRIRAISQFEIDQVAFEEDMEKYLNYQTETHRTLHDFYKRCRNKSKEMMKDAYDLREKVIDRIIEEENARQIIVLPSMTTAKGNKKK